MKTKPIAFRGLHIVPAAFALVLAGSVSSQAAMVFATLTSQDSIVGERQGGTAAAVGYYADEANGTVGVGGGSGNRENRNLIIGFTLPTLTTAIDSVKFSITVTSSNNSAGAIDVDLYGLATATTPDLSFFLEADTDPDTNQTELKDAFTNTSVADGATVETTVTAFISSLYTGNTPNQAEVFFRINPDRNLNTGSNPRRVSFSTSTATLEITTVPEPAVPLLVAVGMFAWLGRRRK